MPFSAWRLTLCVSSVAVVAWVAGCATGFRGDDGGPPRPVDSGAHDSATDGGPKPDVGSDSAVDAGPVCIDMDGDGFGMGCSGGPDCDDHNPNVSPSGTEVCNGTDDDCDSHTDEGLDTPVFCGVGACRTSVPQCASGMTSTCTPRAPGTEICNGIDDNCDGQTDEGFGGMTCGIGACQVTVAACMGGTPPPCVPTSPMPETCNGVDDDCNTMVDDGLPMISCGRGACRRSVAGCAAGVPGVCVPGMPVAESCNGLDDNCDGVIDDGFGALNCGAGACARTVASCTGGVPMSCTPGTPTTETCNNIDDDCNGMIDDGLGLISCGVGACLRSVAACTAGALGTCTPGSPAASETCGNNIDDNCNGAVDELCVTCTPPGNTTCPSAAPYAIGSTVMGNNTCSGNDVSSFTCATGYGSAGFDTTYTFASTGGPTRYTVTMTGPSGYDTVLHAHASTTCNGTDEIACADDSAGANVSTVTIDAPPLGNVYLVADGYHPSEGSTYTLTSSSTSLNNDLCANAIRIVANGTYVGNTAGLGNNGGPPSGTPGCVLGSNAPEVYYSITARTTGTITASLCGSSYDTVLYVGTSCGAYDVVCNDDSGPSCALNQSSLTWPAVAGTTYYIGVDGYSTNAGTFQLAISGY